MQSSRMYLHEDTLESVKEWIEQSLSLGSSVASIVRGMIDTPKAVLIITKEYERHMQEFSSDEEIAALLTEYINDVFKEQIKRSCVSDVIKHVMEKNFYGMDIDDYSEFLTDLLNDGAYQRVNHHITSIMASYEPYMKVEYPKDYDSMTKNEHEVALIKFLKENLCSCANKKPVTQQDNKSQNV